MGRFVSAKKPCFRHNFWTETLISPIFTTSTPPLAIHGWKAMDLSFNLAPSYRDLKDPTSRQNFEDMPGQIPKLILTLRRNLLVFVSSFMGKWGSRKALFRFKSGVTSAATPKPSIQKLSFFQFLVDISLMAPPLQVLWRRASISMGIKFETKFFKFREGVQKKPFFL